MSDLISQAGLALAEEQLLRVLELLLAQRPTTPHRLQRQQLHHHAVFAAFAAALPDALVPPCARSMLVLKLSKEWRRCSVG
eukprot:COSAG04_NODE_157_length_22270_cov_26.745298_11_plen_81_part_00